MLSLLLASVFAEKLDLFSKIETELFGVDNTKKKTSFHPRTDVGETKTHYQITIEVLGINVKDIKIETENRSLFISGEKKQKSEEKDKKTYYQECYYGEFKREFLLPEDALIQGIQAKCANSIIHITIPRKPSDRKIIPIQ